MLYSRVVSLTVAPEGQNSPQVGNGAGTAVGILEVPKCWPPSTTNPSQLVAFRPKEASQPGRPAQCPALKRPASAYEPPANNSKRGYWTGCAGTAGFRGGWHGTGVGGGRGGGALCVGGGRAWGLVREIWPQHARTS